LLIIGEDKRIAAKGDKQQCYPAKRDRQHAVQTMFKLRGTVGDKKLAVVFV
jgi:hypothetical protein